MAASKSFSQLPLDLGVTPSVQREDLAESPANAMAIAMVDAWPNWPGNIAILCGPDGAGKTHIASAWQDMSSAIPLQVGSLADDLARFQDQTDGHAPILLEDVAPGEFDETALFHLFNVVRQNQTSCLMTTNTMPGLWGVKLPDLASRLKTLQVVQIFPPDDFLLKQVMFKLFSDRQIQVSEGVIDYCILRMERSLKFAREFVVEIDREALSRKKAITKQLAGEVLERLGS